MMIMRPAAPQRHDSVAHQRNIEALAREAQVPIEDVTSLYARALAALTAGAQITSFLPLLTTRQVRALLRHRVAAARRSVDQPRTPAR